MLSLLKAFGAPGSINFLAFSCAIGLVLGAIGPRSRRFGRAWLLMLYVGYVVAGMPKVAHAVAHRLPVSRPLPLETVRDAHTLIVLGGDNGVGRLREAERLLGAMSARRVIVSRAPWIAERLVEGGLSRDVVTHERRSTTTREQIVALAPLIRRASPGVVVLASRLQMPRVAALVRAEHLDVLLAPAPVDVEPPERGWSSYVPRYSGLRISRDALYEHAALAYYKWQGWIEKGKG